MILKTLHLNPIPELKPYIKNIWVIEGNTSNNCLTEKMIPFGCMDLVFVENAHLSLVHDNNKEVKLSKAFFSGQVTKPYYLKYYPGIRIIGFGFYPHTAHYFTKISSDVFTDQIIALQDIISLESKTELIIEQLHSIPGLHQKVMYLQKHIYKIIKQSRSIGQKDFYVQHILMSILKNKGELKLTEICNQLNISKRYVQILSNEYIGINPTQYAKIIRFLNSIKYLNQKNISLTSICYQLGYYDQSHFIRDFKRFSGQSPSNYILNEQQIINNFTSQEWSSFLYNELT